MVTILAAIRRFLPSGRRYNKTTLSRLLICVFGACAAIGMAADTRPVFQNGLSHFRRSGMPPAATSPTAWHPPPACNFPEQSAPADRIEAFGKSLVVLVDPKNPANSLLLRKPTARIPHAGGQRIQPGSPEEAALRAWIDRLAQLKGDELAKAMRYREEEASGAGATRARIMLRRLTQQPVQQHGARSAGRPQPARQPVPARGFRQRLQEPVRCRRTSRRCSKTPTARPPRSWPRTAFRGGNAQSLVTCAALAGVPRRSSSRASA